MARLLQAKSKKCLGTRGLRFFRGVGRIPYLRGIWNFEPATLQRERQMKVVIPTGGLGTRLAEETEVKPKPMVEIGGRPILWHIMKLFAHHGFKEFLIALGCKGDVIKGFFLDHYRLNGSMTVNLWNGDTLMHHKKAEDWTVHLHDTGLKVNTGGRVKRLEPYLKNNTSIVTYGNVGSNVNVPELVRFHQALNPFPNPFSLRSIGKKERAAHRGNAI
jgi:NDP-sugar pyrophosphorylase family protein